MAHYKDWLFVGLPLRRVDIAGSQATFCRSKPTTTDATSLIETDRYLCKRSKRTMTKTVTRHSPPAAGPQYSLRMRHQEFAQRLYAVLVDKGWKQSQLARACFGTVKTPAGHTVAKGRDRISAYINGKSLPDPVNLQKMATALGVDVAELAPDLHYATATREEPEFYIHKIPGEDKAHIKLERSVPLQLAYEIYGLLLRYDAEMGASTRNTLTTPGLNHEGARAEAFANAKPIGAPVPKPRAVKKEK